MPIDSAAVTANPGQGRPSVTALMVYLLLAGLLMLLDQRGQFIPRFRAFAEGLVTPVYRVAEAPVEAVRGIRRYGRSWDSLVAQTREQREQLMAQSGQMQRLAALEEENRRLRALLDATAGRDIEFRFAELVQVSLDPYSHQVLIDRGVDDGVFEGQAVIDGQGVMGQVEGVTGGQSRVRLISDPDHALPVQILRTGQRTVAMGTGDVGRLSLPNLPEQSDVREGDVLVTSGLGERFPAGFPVAEVSRVVRDTGEAFMDVDARPLAALDRGREVLLVMSVPAPPDVRDMPATEIPDEALADAVDEAGTGNDASSGDATAAEAAEGPVLDDPAAEPAESSEQPADPPNDVAPVEGGETP